MGKKKGNKSNQNQQSNQNRPSPKAEAKPTEPEEEKSSLFGNLCGAVSNAVGAVIGSSPTETEDKTQAPVAKIEKSEPEKPAAEEQAMAKRSAAEMQDANDAMSPEDKRGKFVADGMDEDVAEIMVKMEDMSGKQKKKLREKMKKDNVNLYDRYIAEKTKRPDGSDSPQKPESKAKKETDEKPASKPEPEKKPKEKEEKKHEEVKTEKSKTSPVKVKRDTPLPEPTEEKKKMAKELIEGMSWEEKDWDQEEEDTKDEKPSSGELPETREKVSFKMGITKDANTQDWSEPKSKKKERAEPQQEKKGEEEGARAKEGSAKKKSKKNKNKNKDKQMKMTDYPPGHENYVPPSERQQSSHVPRQYSPGRGQGERSRSSSSNARKSWDPPPSKRRDGSIILQVVKGDLFSAPDHYSLVHCVSADFRMGKGIAVQFKRLFGGVGELFNFGAGPGEMAYLRRQNRFIYYLVTKPQYNMKPTMKSLASSLRCMRDHCVANDVRHLAMPTIGCGLDKLDWGNVRHLLEDTFLDTPVEITVFMV